MNILILWSYSTWKTTLINEFKNKFPQYKIKELPDIARLILERDGLNINKFTPIKMIEFQKQVYKEFDSIRIQIASSKQEDEILIFDWADLLSLVYYTDSQNYSLNNVLSSIDKDSHLENLINNSIDWKEKFDLILYLPIEFELCVDWTRQSSDTKRKDIDNRLTFLMRELWYSFTKLSWTVSERIRILEELVEERLSYNCV